MPYITQKSRDYLQGKFIEDNVFSKKAPRDVGELNYEITQLVLGYLPTNPRYADYNSVVGVLESAKLEFYRRAVATYENQKAFDNGDVYQPPISAVMEGNTSDV